MDLRAPIVRKTERTMPSDADQAALLFRALG
jgi:hypothetical protein